MAPGRSFAWRRDDAAMNVQREMLLQEKAELEEGGLMTPLARTRHTIVDQCLEWLGYARNVYLDASLEANATVWHCQEMIHLLYGIPPVGSEEDLDLVWVETRVREAVRDAILQTVMKRERDAHEEFKPNLTRLEVMERRRKARFWAWVRGRAWNV